MFCCVNRVSDLVEYAVHHFSAHAVVTHWHHHVLLFLLRGGSWWHASCAGSIEGRHPSSEASGGGETAPGSFGKGGGQCSWEAGEGVLVHVHVFYHRGIVSKRFEQSFFYLLARLPQMNHLFGFYYYIFNEALLVLTKQCNSVMLSKFIMSSF